MTTALLDALTGRVPPVGRLPFDLPRSMEQVRSHPEDVATATSGHDLAHPRTQEHFVESGPYTTLSARTAPDSATG